MHNADVSLLDHPLDAFATHLRSRHAEMVSEHFEGLVAMSGVDERENRELVGELRRLDRGIAEAESSRTGWRVAGVAGAVTAVASAVAAFVIQGPALLLLLVAIAAAVLLLLKVRPTLAELQAQLQQLGGQRDAVRAQAQAQMEPLNRLHDWGVAPALFQAALPAVQFDPHVSRARLADLVSTYGLAADFGTGRSTLFAQSGEFRGNPFLFQRSLDHWIGSRTYTGSIVIHWTQPGHSRDGKYVNTHRSQTLTASVVKPYPTFQERTRLFYGHEAAPTLSFSRGPSELSGLEDGFVNDWRVNRQIKKVERQARREVMSGAEDQLTVMSNREFEALFDATDRDDETAFRLLFTPLAQAEMVKLLNDRSTGFGDNFTFTKSGGINVVEAQHLDRTRFDADPGLFQSLDLAEARRTFNAFHAEYFKALFFNLAPLLVIPPYREQRSVPGGVTESDSLQTCEWEHEALANLLGESAFQHPESTTRNLLKTTSSEVAPGVRSVDVTAFGYRGEARVDYVRMRGGDGYYHDVPVPWTEYFQIHNTRTMLVGAVAGPLQDTGGADHKGLRPDWESALSQHGLGSGATVTRGTLVGHLLDR